MSDKKITEMMREQLRQWAARPSTERFRELVVTGLVNKAGALTTRYGGDAEPEPESRAGSTTPPVRS
jgi:hypothetical protein